MLSPELEKALQIEMRKDRYTQMELSIAEEEALFTLRALQPELFNDAYIADRVLSVSIAAQTPAITKITGLDEPTP